MHRKHALICAVAGLLGAMLFLSAPSRSEAKDIRYRKEFKEKRYLAEDVVNQNIDKNKDGVLSQRERNAVTKFTVGTGTFERSDNVVIALDDLKYFPNLREVVLGQRVSTLKPLYSLKKIESLTIPSGSVAYKKSIRLDKFPKLKKLSVTIRGITLNVTKNKRLQELNCASCGLKKLDLSKNPNLTKVVCNDNQLTGITFHKKAKIRKLNCSMNCIRTLNHLNTEKLEELNCSGNCLNALELGQALRLKSATIGGNEWQAVDLRNCQKLQFLSVEDNVGPCKVVLPKHEIAGLFVDEKCQVEIVQRISKT